MNLESTTNIIGKLYYGSYANILSDEGDWLRISTGTIKEAFIYKDFTLIGYEAAKILDLDRDEDGNRKVTGKLTTAVKCRLTPAENAESDGILARNTAVYVDFTKSMGSGPTGWFYVTTMDKNPKSCYVSAQYVSLSYAYDVGLTFDEIADLTLDNKVRSAYANKQIPYIPSNGNEIGHVQGTTTDRGHTTDMTDAEFYLFATIIATEAGDQDYDGMLAVANVIINRMELGWWGTTLNDVIFAKNQFDGASAHLIYKVQSSGVLERNPIYYQVARDACNGINNIGDYYFFRTESSALKKNSTNGAYDCPLLHFDDFCIVGKEGTNRHIFFHRTDWSTE